MDDEQADGGGETDLATISEDMDLEVLPETGQLDITAGKERLRLIRMRRGGNHRKPPTRAGVRKSLLSTAAHDDWSPTGVGPRRDSGFVSDWEPSASAGFPDRDVTEGEGQGQAGVRGRVGASPARGATSHPVASPRHAASPDKDPWTGAPKPPGGLGGLFSGTAVLPQGLSSAVRMPKLRSVQSKEPRGVSSNSDDSPTIPPKSSNTYTFQPPIPKKRHTVAGARDKLSGNRVPSGPIPASVSPRTSTSPSTAAVESMKPMAGSKTDRMMTTSIGVSRNRGQSDRVSSPSNSLVRPESPDPALSWRGRLKKQVDPSSNYEVPTRHAVIQEIPESSPPVLPRKLGRVFPTPVVNKNARSAIETHASSELSSKTSTNPDTSKTVISSSFANQLSSCMAAPPKAPRVGLTNKSAGSESNTYSSVAQSSFSERPKQNVGLGQNQGVPSRAYNEPRPSLSRSHRRSSGENSNSIGGAGASPSGAVGFDRIRVPITEPKTGDNHRDRGSYGTNGSGNVNNSNMNVNTSGEYSSLKMEAVVHPARPPKPVHLTKTGRSPHKANNVPRVDVEPEYRTRKIAEPFLPSKEESSDEENLVYATLDHTPYVKPQAEKAKADEEEDGDVYADRNAIRYHLGMSTSSDDEGDDNRYGYHDTDSDMQRVTYTTVKPTTTGHDFEAEVVEARQAVTFDEVRNAATDGASDNYIMDGRTSREEFMDLASRASTNVSVSRANLPSKSVAFSPPRNSNSKVAERENEERRDNSRRAGQGETARVEAGPVFKSPVSSGAFTTEAVGISSASTQGSGEWPSAVTRVRRGPSSPSKWRHTYHEENSETLGIATSPGMRALGSLEDPVTGPGDGKDSERSGVIKGFVRGGMPSHSRGTDGIRVSIGAGASDRMQADHSALSMARGRSMMERGSTGGVETGKPNWMEAARIKRQRFSELFAESEDKETLTDDLVLAKASGGKLKLFSGGPNQHLDSRNTAGTYDREASRPGSEVGVSLPRLSNPELNETVVDVGKDDYYSRNLGGNMGVSRSQHSMKESPSGSGGIRNKITDRLASPIRLHYSQSVGKGYTGPGRMAANGSSETPLWKQNLLHKRQSGSIADVGSHTEPIATTSDGVFSYKRVDVVEKVGQADMKSQTPDLIKDVQRSNSRRIQLHNSTSGVSSASTAAGPRADGKDTPAATPPRCASDSAEPEFMRLAREKQARLAKFTAKEVR